MQDPRISDILVRRENVNDTKEFDIAILGFPFDEGVQRNGGRIGSSLGPASFRKFSTRICASDSQRQLDFKNLKIVDCGDAIGDTLELAHQDLQEKVFKLLRNDTLPFVVGGGNDESFPNAMGLLRAANEMKKSVLVINLDAHLDVRPLKDGKVHSGSPFRLMLESKLFVDCNGKFIEFASQGSQCSLEHVRYAQSHGTRIIWLDEMTRMDPVNGIIKEFEKLLFNSKEDFIFVSFDLDCVQAADAPYDNDLSKGVSCSSPTGLTARDTLEICRMAGADKRVKLFDLSEYNPNIEEYQTGRLVAMMFHAFLTGFLQRVEQR